MNTATHNSEYNAGLRSQIKELIRPLISNTALLDNVNDDTQLEADLDMDSARTVDIILGLEEHFGISIGDDRMDTLKTVGDLVRTVKELTSQGEVKLA